MPREQGMVMTMMMMMTVRVTNCRLTKCQLPCLALSLSSFIYSDSDPVVGTMNPIL